MYIYIYTSLCICMHVFICIMGAYMYVHTGTCMCVQVCVFLSVYCICTYMCVNMNL